MKRVSIYIDGFNLYHALCELREDHLKWLDLWSLSQTIIRKGETLETVKYFTAYATWRPSSYRRHQRYIAALQKRGVQPIIGRFKEKKLRCQAKCRQSFTTHEEKETDVNIGVHLIADALLDRFDRAIVISADTDLNAAVTLARQESNGKLIDIAAPPGRKGRNSVAQFEVTKGRVRKSLLPAAISLDGARTVTRPSEYDPPTV